MTPLVFLRPKDRHNIFVEPEPKPSFENYNVEVVCEVLTVREGPSTDYNWIPFNNLTPNAREQIINLCGHAVNGLCEGCIATVFEQQNNWGHIPSGWICLDYTRRI